MTSDNIKKVQILVEFDNGEYALAVSDNSILLRMIVELCKFFKVDKSAVGTVNIKDITE